MCVLTSISQAKTSQRAYDSHDSYVIKKILNSLKFRNVMPGIWVQWWKGISRIKSAVNCRSNTDKLQWMMPVLQVAERKNVQNI